MAHGMEGSLPRGTNFRIVCFQLRNPGPDTHANPSPYIAAPSAPSGRAQSASVSDQMDQENLPATDMRCLTVAHGAQQLCGDDPGTRTALAREHPVLREERSDLDHIESAEQAPGARRHAVNGLRSAVTAQSAPVPPRRTARIAPAVCL